jgi:hypothetical protein
MSDSRRPGLGYPALLAWTLERVVADLQARQRAGASGEVPVAPEPPAADSEPKVAPSVATGGAE